MKKLKPTSMLIVVVIFTGMTLLTLGGFGSIM